MNLKDLFYSTTIADRVLFSVLIILSLSGILFIREVLPRGQDVRIEVDGRPVYVLSLDNERTVSVEGPAGKTFVEIKDHMVRVIESPCHNKLCVHQGWIRSGAIVCVPNKVVVKIGTEEKKENLIDAITG